ncbi:hypothetical protein [Sphingobacterium siyangense]|uniref:hypothetical protein n=1 Tax=Sphingobacterium siyangense TaxID=459529 RepID=UPI002FDE82AB
MQASFPRIHSLSTVGIIYHYNADYLFHPFRTDFTGEGGSGKTMVADMIQLVLLGSTTYRSATEGTDKRPIEGLVMHAKNGRYGAGYVVMNIQIAPYEYIAIGCFIEKSSKQTRMFIAQAGYDWDNKLEPLKKPVYHRDFIVEDTILSVEKLNETLKHIHLKPLSISIYHQLLYKNGILNIDLTHKKTLDSYGSIFRSFARGKGLKTDSDNLKDFLFGDDDKVHLASYQQQIKSISEDYSEHERYQNEIQDIRKKEAHIKNLVKLESDYKDIEQKYRRDKAYFWHHQAVYTRKKYQAALKDYEKFAIGLQSVKMQGAKLYLEELQIKVDQYREWKNRLIDLTEKKEVFTGQKQDLQNKIIDLHWQLRKIDDVDILIQECGGEDELKRKVTFERKFSSEKDLLFEFLNYLKDQDISSVFEKSLWSVDYERAKKEYIEKRTQLIKKINEYEGLSRFSNIEDSNSLASWAIEHINRPLTHEEESILIHFQLFPRQKPMNFEEKDRYLPNPRQLFNNPDIKDKLEGKGFWLNLDGVYEYIKYVQNQYLNTDPDTIRNRLAALNKSLAHDLSDLQIQLEQIQLLDAKLHDFNQLRTVLPIYIDRTYYNRDVDKRFIISQVELDNLLSLKANIAVLLQEKKRYEKENEELIRSDNSVFIEQIKSDISNCEKYFKDNDVKLTTLDEETAKAKLDLTINESELDSLLNSLSIVSFKEGEKMAQQAIRELHSHQLCNKSLVQKADEFNILKADLEKSKTSTEKSEEKIKEAALEYFKFFGEPFQPDSQIECPTDPEEGGNLSLKESWQTAKISFEQNYKTVVSGMEDNAKLLDGYNVGQLAYQLLPSVFKNARAIASQSVEVLLADKLASLEQAIREIGSRKLEILKKVFSEVQKTYRDYIVKVIDIDKYFNGSTKRITGGSKASLVHEISTDYPADWLNVFTKILNNELSFTGMFEELARESDINKIMIKAFTDSGGLSGAKIEDLLNPKSYFNLEFKLKLDTGESNSGSNSQAYSGYALLGLARLALIGNNKLPGIKIMPIDEAQGLGSNYEMLREVALEEGYQILSMSIESAGELRDGEQYIYMLSENKLHDEESHVPAMAVFNDRDVLTDISDFIKNLHADT